ncbi:membrane protein insertion efficiency factor YidD [Campylobacter fetus]|nr:membrane protein insertion efficiency factor YidD [Campylobacter fetus]ALV64538.1 membrane protein insertion efficiency factor, YidD family [Campylobacter fetus subsp. testudinum Sp3]
MGFKKIGFYKMKVIFWNFIIFYKKYISPILPKSCRYYPTCSEYALWQLRYNGFFYSIVAIFLRILRCNQLFRGGIDYPLVKRKFTPYTIFSKNKPCKMNFWFVPHRKGGFYLIKVFDSLKET